MTAPTMQAGDIGPIQLKRVNEARNEVTRLCNTFKKLSNYLAAGEVKESEVVLWSFPGNFPEWKATVLAELDKLDASYSYEVNRDNHKDYIADLEKLEATLAAQIPVSDERSTVEQLEQRHAEAMEHRKVQEAKAEAADRRKARFADFTGRLITIAKEIDDSDIMTDYFGTRTLETWVLERTHERRDMISLLKATVNKYASLRGLQWEEHREKYSMGRGYYITSSAIPDAEPVKNYGHYMAAPYYIVRYAEVEWAGGNPDWPEEPDAPQAQELSSGNGATVSLNEEHNGVEVRFDAKPPEETRTALKAHGFRWSRPQRLWYAKQSPERIAFAESLAT